jgi:hypothetical protein
MVITIHMNSSKVILTGCDRNTEWMLPWFIDNYVKHNSLPICFANFGITENTMDWLLTQPIVQNIINIKPDVTDGWFLKPKAMKECPYEYTCWIDTDCHIVGDISGIFNYVEPNKLAMVEDLPWSKRRGQTWHNSGVVAFKDKPIILNDWVNNCKDGKKIGEVLGTGDPGDQDVLHYLLNTPIKRLTHIVDLPNKYNVTRVQHIDNTVPKEVLIYHWTGHKGKVKIQELINAK